jgi:hypothetical protein
MVALRPRSFGYARARTRQVAVGGALVLSLLVTGCGAGGAARSSAESAPSPSSPTATASTSATALAEQQILTAYQGFWNVQVEVLTQGTLQGMPINKYAIDNADYEIRENLQYYLSQNLVMHGRPVLNPHVTALNLATKPYTATITDCIDSANYFPVNKTTGQPAQLTSPVTRHPATYTARYGAQWWIVDGTIDRNKTC